MLFWTLFLFTLFPYSLIGTGYSLYGFYQAKKYNNFHKKAAGVSNMMLAIPLLIVGFFGFGLLILVTCY